MRGASYAEAKKRLDAAQYRLGRWDAALRNPRKFQPIMKIEWNTAFDAREAAAQAACRADPDMFVTDYPSWSWLAVYLGLREPEGSAA